MSSSIPSPPPTTLSTITLPDSTTIFYRTAGSPSHPPLVLLHGFPSSSHQYRHLLPALSKTHHVLAPDLPGFGFTTCPSTYTYTFASLTETLLAFLDALQISRFAVYIFDYGAPVAFRLALQRPHAITAIISQNGNAYLEGLVPTFWAPVQKYWTSNSATDREYLLENILTLAATKWQYESGTPAAKLASIAPETYTLDYALMCRDGNKDIQLDLLRDYQTNVALYPRFQAWMRERQVPLLAIWGEHDVAFAAEGAWAFRRDLPGAEVVLVDAGHFALETEGERIAGEVRGFLGRVGGLEDGF